MATVDISPVLKFMVEKGASDLYFSTNAPIHVDIEGETIPINQQMMQAGMVKDIAYSLMSEQQINEFECTLECNFALNRPEIGRFRVNVFQQRNEVAMVMRHIKTEIPNFDHLGLPPIMKELVMRKRGLLLMVGSTGSGKTTTLASLIDYRNQNATGHIITIEDPIEFIHMHKRSLVNQREVGIDTLSFDNALKNAMRQSPNVIFIGEIRDMETMKLALTYAETGHLCLATLHSNNANQALERITSMFPIDARESLLLSLSLNLVGIMSQRLIPGKAQKRVAANEILINTAYIADLIQKQKLHDIKENMANSNDLGMCTFDQSLFRLYSNGKVDEANALAYADSRKDLTIQIRFAEEGQKNF